jgi:hypothetical protein
MVCFNVAKNLVVPWPISPSSYPNSPKGMVGAFLGAFSKIQFAIVVKYLHVIRTVGIRPWAPYTSRLRDKSAKPFFVVRDQVCWNYFADKMTIGAISKFVGAKYA